MKESSNVHSLWKSVSTMNFVDEDCFLAVCYHYQSV